MASETAVLAVFIFAFLTGVPSNLLAFYTFLAKLRHKPTPTDIFLLNLSLSDIILLLVLPVKMVEVSSHMTWSLPPSLCPLTSCCFYGSMYLSILFLASISVDRFLGIVYPIKYKMHRRPVYALVTCICFWLLVFSHCSIIYTYRYGGSNESIPYSPNTSRCYDNFSPQQLRVIVSLRLELCLFFFCFPFIITLFCYVKVIHLLSSLSNVKPSKKRRAVGLAVATLLNFIICFAPYNVSHMVGFIKNQSPPWRMEALLLSTLNTCVDPVIFFFSSKAIRRTINECWGAMFLRLQTVVFCSKHPTNNDGVDADQVLSSGLQSRYEGADAQTKTFLDQPAKTCAIRAQDSPQQTQHTAL